MPRAKPISTAALILDDGDERALRSSLPRLLQPCADLPLVVHVVRAAAAAGAMPIVVALGPGSTRVREVLSASLPEKGLLVVTHRGGGMADALAAGLGALEGFSGRVLLLPADMPLVSPATLKRLQRAARGKRVAILGSAHGDEGALCFGEASLLAGAAPRRGAKRGPRSEPHALSEGLPLLDAVQVAVEDDSELQRVHDLTDLAAVEAALRARLVTYHQRRGVTLHDPQGSFIGADVRLERDVVLGVGVQLAGQVRVGRGARIEGPTLIKDSSIGAGALVHAFCHLEGATVALGASVGPFARLRTGAHLEEGAKVGNFVEIKKTRLGKGAKANHLAYLGDAEVGAGSNVGAGTITCNYDGGPVKHRTTIDKGVFIGSNTTLVAPVRLGKGAFVAAGSTVTHDVPDDALAFGRARQKNLDGHAVTLRTRIAKGAR